MSNTPCVTDIGIAIAGSVDSGKCFVKGTQIKLFNSTVKNVEDINFEDEIMGDDFTKRNIKHIHSGTSAIFNIIVENHLGKEILAYGCNPYHEVQYIFMDNVIGKKYYYTNSILNVQRLVNNGDELFLYKNYNLYDSSKNILFKIKKIEYIKEGEYFGFEVDRNHLFQLGNGFVVHNSTFVGVMSSNILDDGNGKARALVATHPHEIEQGKTSNISSKLLMVPEMNRAITLIDLCGHEKYFKTTAYGISGHFPDYGFIFVSVNRGVVIMTKEHFKLLQSLNIPVVVIITHADSAPEEMYNLTRKAIEKFCKLNFKTSIEFINNYYSVIEDKNKFYEEKIDYLKKIFNPETMQSKQLVIPTITISNKTGYFVDFIKKFLTILKPRNLFTNFKMELYDKDKNNLIDICTNRIVRGFMNKMDKTIFKPYDNSNLTVFYVDGIYSPPGIGIVLAGIHRGKPIKTGDTVYLGPFGKEFKECKVRSIFNYNRQKINQMENHYRVTVSLNIYDKHVTRYTINKGMILVRTAEEGKSLLTYRFSSVVTIFNHSSSIQNGYSPQLQIGNVRQPVRLILTKDETDNVSMIKGGDYALVEFKFKIKPEFIEPYQIFIFRCGTVHGIGMVVQPVPLELDEFAKPDPIKFKRIRNKYHNSVEKYLINSSNRN